jgi:pimeloyl-ACP methyl ester carboxylesterase
MRHPVRLALLLLLLPLLPGCPPSPSELASQTSWDLARERGRFVEVQALQMFAITLGQGRDVVLLHGDPDSARTWKRVIGPLAEHYRVHAIDLPGFGFSDKPAASPYDDAWLASHVVGYLDAAGVERAVLVGNSMGGAIATEVAMRHPDRVSGLVLLGAAGLPYPDQEAPLPWYVRLLRYPALSWIGPLIPGGRAMVADGLRRAVYDPDSISEDEVDAFYAPLTSRHGMIANLTRASLVPDADRVNRVRGIRAPTLIIAGDTDRLVPNEVSRRYHELIPGSELLILEQTGHIPQVERPERVEAEIIRWVDSHPSKEGNGRPR